MPCTDATVLINTFCCGSLEAGPHPVLPECKCDKCDAVHCMHACLHPGLSSAQLLKRGDRVAAAVRNPHNAPLLKPLAENYGSQLLIVKMDVLDAASIKAGH